MPHEYTKCYGDEDTIDWEKSHYFSFRPQNNNSLNKRPGFV